MENIQATYANNNLVALSAKSKIRVVFEPKI